MKSQQDGATENDNQGAQKKIVPEPSAVEIRDLRSLLDSAHKAYSRIGLMMILGVILLIACSLYYNKFDYYPVKDSAEWKNFSGQYLPSIVESEHNQQAESYVLRPGITTPPRVPQWPEVMYAKLRFDIYFVGVAVFLLCLVCIKISRAKSDKNDLLVFRSMAREIERLRVQLAEGDAKGGKPNDDSGDNS